MAGPSRRRKAPKRKAPASLRQRPAALGNDPFERGAATRDVAPTPTPTPTQTSTSTSIPTPTPTPTSIPTSTPARAVAAAASAASTRIAGVERRIDAALDGLETRLEDLASRAGIATAQGEVREVVARLLPALRARLGALADLVRLLEPPQRLDRYGMDARFAERLAPLVELLYSSWWRVQVRDISAVPASGPAIIVANHAGVVPWDAFVLRHALRRDHPAHRELRPLLDDRECAQPIIGSAAVRSGAVRASADAAARILGAGGLIAVFPEGSAGARKPWRDRYRIARFGRGGFAKVALRARAPIVPCAIVGSEEASPGISRTGWVADRLGIPLLPGSAALRVTVAALLPLPSRWSLRFGTPVEVGAAGGAAAEDPSVVNQLTERVRAALQAMLDEDVAGRSSVFL